MTEKANDLIALLAAVNIYEVKPPGNSPVEDDEIEVGVLGDHEKRLWALLNQYTLKCKGHVDRIEELTAAHRALHSQGKVDEQVCRENDAAIAQIKHEAKPDKDALSLLEDLFWNTVRFNFPELRGKYNIGLRDCFKLVYKNNTALEGLNLYGLFTGLFGNIHTAGKN